MKFVVVVLALIAFVLVAIGFVTVNTKVSKWFLYSGLFLSVVTMFALAALNFV